MELKLLDIEKYIQKNKLKPVTSSRVYTGGRQNLDPNGLFSEDIFGRLGSRERRNRFGYIELNCKVIHPEIWPIITSINPDLTKLIMGKSRYVISDGLIVEDKTNGSAGLAFFINNFKDIDFDKMPSQKDDHIKFINKHKDKIFITKYLILPAGIRDIQINSKGGTAQIQFSDIMTLYERLIKQTHSLEGDISILPEEIADSMMAKIQRSLCEISSWIKDKLKGKHGVIRGGLLKKATDYSGRMIIAPDPKLKLGYVGIPWQIALKLHEPFTIHQLLYKRDDLRQAIQTYLSNDTPIDIRDIKRFINKINDDPYTVQGKLKQDLIDLAKEIVRDKVIAYKRDPTENRDSWISSYMRIDDTGFTMKLNPFDLCKNGGDFDGDAASIFAILTDEAQEQAKKSMNPRHTKTAWQPGGNAGKTAYNITLDASTAIYSATKK